MELIIKDEFLNTVVGFNNSSLPLGERPDLHVLFELATKSNNKNLLNYFKEIPTKEEFKQIKESQILEETKTEGNGSSKITEQSKPKGRQNNTRSE